MTNKELYQDFCTKVYVPIYSKSWWMDAICGEENWDVWLYEKGGEIVAAMPYYLEQRKAGLYITKPPLTQNNGIIFKYPDGAGKIAQAKFEEKVIDAANEFIDNLGLAVYEQQFHYSFTNWLPFSWQGCTALPRYTYVIDRAELIGDIWYGLSAKQRSCVKKGKRNTQRIGEISSEDFYNLHKQIFERQGLACPFSEELWHRLDEICEKHKCCKKLAAFTDNGQVASLIYLIWDERSVYHLLGGGMQEFRNLDTYAALIWRGIELSRELDLAYDFEGSMIKRISKSFREFGGQPKLYFRIRKIYSPEVVEMEADQMIAKLKKRGGQAKCPIIAFPEYYMEAA